MSTFQIISIIAIIGICIYGVGKYRKNRIFKSFKEPLNQDDISFINKNSNDESLSSEEQSFIKEYMEEMNKRIN